MRFLTKELVFSNQRRHWLARHGLFWLVWTVFFSFIYSFLPAGYMVQRGIPWPIAFLKGLAFASIESVLFMPAHMILTYGILYWLIPRFVFKDRYGWIIINGVLLLMVATFTSASLSLFLVEPIRLRMGGTPAGNSFVLAMIAGLRGGTTVGGFAAAIKLVKVWYLKQQAYQQVEREKLQAELQLLKSQIHPHFLFNTLNNLYALTLRQSDQSSAMVLKLSELLSYMLYDCNASEVPLEKEISFMRNYIDLEQVRYGDRLDMSINISGNYEHTRIAPLLLIPFLENAFKHGTSEQLEQAWMHIDLSVHQTTLKFKVINSREVTKQDETYVGGIGLQNVKKRLQLLYADRHKLRITAQDETFMILLMLELSPAKATALPEANRMEAV